MKIRQGAWFEPLEDMKGKIAGIVSNPPYIPTGDLPGLQPEVGWFEPTLALDGGKDGTDHLLHICEGLVAALQPGGFFAFEVFVIHQENILDVLSLYIFSIYIAQQQSLNLFNEDG